MKKITVLGAGSWGTAIALLLNSNSHKIILWDKITEHLAALDKNRENIKYLPGIKIPDEIKFEESLLKAVSDSSIIVNAVPTQYIRNVYNEIPVQLIRGKIIINLSKGIEISSLKRISEIFTELFGAEINSDYCVLTGPSHAEEVSIHKPASLIAASQNYEIAVECQNLFNTDYFRVYTGTDIAGAEIGGAVKNVIAIAAGICDGLKLGDNARAALVTRGLAEIARFGAGFGAQSQTFSGLSGLGDLIVTCGSIHSRNYRCGKLLAEGYDINTINNKIAQIIEGVSTAAAVCSLAKTKNIEMPICEQVNDLINSKVSAAEAVKILMTRLAKPEFY